MVHAPPSEDTTVLTVHESEEPRTVRPSSFLIGLALAFTAVLAIVVAATGAPPAISEEYQLDATGKPIFNRPVEQEVQAYADVYHKWINPDSRFVTNQHVEVPANIGTPFSQKKYGNEGAVFYVSALHSIFPAITTKRAGDRMVAFRHMEASLTDLLTNLGGSNGGTALVPLMDASFICKGCKIHKGYLQATMALMKDAQYSQFRRSLLNGNKKLRISVTGYSQGAGLAVVFAALLQSKGYPIQKVIAFSGAKLGNLAFRSWTKRNGLYDKIWRPVYQRDPVAKLPPSWMHYYHTGWEIHYSCPSNSRIWNFFSGTPQYTAKFCKAGDSVTCGVRQYDLPNPLDHINCPLGLGTDLDFTGRCKRCSGFKYGTP